MIIIIIIIRRRRREEDEDEEIGKNKLYNANKLSLYSGGFYGLHNQFGAYQIWCRTTSIRAQCYEKKLEMVDVISDPDCPRSGRHRELEKAEVKKSEEPVQRVLAVIRNFTIHFTVVDKNRLYSLASCAPVDKDVLRTEAVGMAAKADFIGCLQSGEPGSFFYLIKKKTLKIMETCNKKVTLISSQGKVIVCSNSRDLLCFNCCIFSASHYFYFW